MVASVLNFIILFSSTPNRSAFTVAQLFAAMGGEGCEQCGAAEGIFHRVETLGSISGEVANAFACCVIRYQLVSIFSG